jgi:hypothetical protein
VAPASRTIVQDPSLTEWNQGDEKKGKVERRIVRLKLSLPIAGRTDTELFVNVASTAVPGSDPVDSERHAAISPW